jgi:hypothetical protein
MFQLQKLRRTELTGSYEPNTGQSRVKPEGELCANCGPLAPLIVTSAIRPKRTK